MVTGNAWMRLLGQAVHRLCHALKEECFGTRFISVAIGRGDQFLGFGYAECCK